MLRRLLITWLLVSIVGYGMALAADVHVELSSDQTHAIGDHATDPTDTGDEADCDHCCHGVLHLLGLKSDGNLDVPDDRNALRFPYSFLIKSTSPTTLLRPPILS